jgi:hypothetical protein
VENLERNDCSIRSQLTCPEGDIPQFELDSPLTEPSDVKDLDEIQATNLISVPMEEMRDQNNLQVKKATMISQIQPVKTTMMIQSKLQMMNPKTNHRKIMK